MDISWDHLKELYMKNRSQGDDAGLSLVPKLKYEHLHLTSYSKMRVDLAAQWLTDVFLVYLDEWEESVKGREDLDKSQIILMMLSAETRQGLRLTVMSFVELVQYAFTIPGVSVFLSNRFTLRSRPSPPLPRRPLPSLTYPRPLPPRPLSPRHLPPRPRRLPSRPRPGRGEDGAGRGEGDVARGEAKAVLDGEMAVLAAVANVVLDVGKAVLDGVPSTAIIIAISPSTTAF
ncbi:hypothetical protein EMCRGX_G000963 [Ephydatia muelleri]